MVTNRTNIFANAIQGIVWRAEHTWNMDVGTPMYFGFVVPEIEIVALSRDYETEGKSMKVDLYEASFTGGAAVETFNRRLKYRNNTPPMQFYAAVTPGVLTDRITGFDIETTAGVRVGRRGDLEPYVHDSLKSYVISVAATIAGAEDYFFGVDYRLLQPGEAL